jgi:hypothetical protein
MVLSSVLVAALATTSGHGGNPVYTVAQVQAGLADHPQVWVGRTVQVRGMTEPCLWWGGTTSLWQCADDLLVLISGPSDAVAEPLPLGQTAGTMLDLLRGLPVLRDLLARPGRVPMYTPSRFRVRLQRLAAQSCGGRAPCYVALLLEVAPEASKEL